MNTSAQSKPSADAGTHIPRSPRVGGHIDWRPIAERPPYDEQPGRQFIWVEGECDHSGRSWRRVHWGIAFTCRDGDGGRLGYRADDIKRIAAEGDMHWLSAVVTHWAPISVNAPEAPASVAARDMGSRVAAQVADDAPGSAPNPLSPTPDIEHLAESRVGMEGT